MLHLDLEEVQDFVQEYFENSDKNVDYFNTIKIVDAIFDVGHDAFGDSDYTEFETVSDYVTYLGDEWFDKLILDNDYSEVDIREVVSYIDRQVNYCIAKHKQSNNRSLAARQESFEREIGLKTVSWRAEASRVLAQKVKDCGSDFELKTLKTFINIVWRA